MGVYTRRVVKAARIFFNLNRLGRNLFPVELSITAKNARFGKLVKAQRSV